jgi:DNA-directed RNA polymerase alpha subunit
MIAAHTGRVRHRIRGERGQVNALRRALIADLETVAPSHCVIRTNTSCQPDEYIAHRIGLIPFEQAAGSDGVARLNVSGRDALSADIVGVGAAPEPIHKNMLIMPLGSDQEIDMTIHFARGTGALHAQYSKTVAVGMMSHENETHELSFETIFGDSEACMAEAIDSLEARLREARVVAVGSTQ